MQAYHLYDGLGSTTDLTDGSGNVTAGYGYDVFGGVRTQSGTGDTDFKFTGEQLDADSELYYLRARYYDPATGRFLSQDPLAAGHLYGYAGNNPVNFVDPSGLCHKRLGYDLICRIVHDKEGSSFDEGSLYRICTDIGCFLTRDDPSTIFPEGYICLFALPGEPRDCAPIPSGIGGTGCNTAEAVTGALLSILGAIAIGVPATIALLTPGLQTGGIILIEGPGVIVEAAAITLIIDSGCLD